MATEGSKEPQPDPSTTPAKARPGEGTRGAEQDSDTSDWDALIPKSLRSYLARIWPQLSQNLTLILGAAATLVIALRVLYVARYDPAVALALIQEGGAATILAMLLQMLPGVIGAIAGVLGALVILSYLPPPPYGPGDRSMAVMGGSGIVVAIAVAPASILLIISFLAIGLAWLMRREAAPGTPPETRDTEEVLVESGRLPRWGTVIAAGVGTFVIGQLLIATGMWLPAEQMEVDGLELVGYAVHADGTWTTILVNEDASVLRVRTDDIDSRTICSIEETRLWDRPLYAMAAPDVTPSCPQSTD